MEDIEDIEEVPKSILKPTKIRKRSVVAEKPAGVVKVKVEKVKKERSARTPEQIQAAKDKMAQVRAARKPKVPKESKE